MRSWQIVAFAFTMLAFVFKLSIVQKMRHLKKSKSLVVVKQAVGFFQLSLVLLVRYLAKTRTIPHLGECSHGSLIFKTKLRTHAIYFKGLCILRPRGGYFLTDLSLCSTKKAGPVLSPSPTPSP